MNLCEKRKNTIHSLCTRIFPTVFSTISSQAPRDFWRDSKVSAKFPSTAKRADDSWKVNCVTQRRRYQHKSAGARIGDVKWEIYTRRARGASRKRGFAYQSYCKGDRDHGRQGVAGIMRAVPIPAVKHDILYANFVGACEIRVTASDIV